MLSASGSQGARGGQGIAAAQARDQRMIEADQAAHDTRLARRVGRAGQHGRSLAREAAALRAQFGPLLAGLPPAVVADVVAKTQEHRQGQAEQRKGHGIEVAGREPLARVQPRNDTGQRDDDGNLGGNVRNDGAAQNEQQAPGGRARTDNHDNLATTELRQPQL